MAKLSLKEVRSALGLQFLILIGRCNKLISSQHLHVMWHNYYFITSNFSRLVYISRAPRHSPGASRKKCLFICVNSVIYLFFLYMCQLIDLFIFMCQMSDRFIFYWVWKVINDFDLTFLWLFFFVCFHGTLNRHN